MSLAAFLAGAKRVCVVWDGDSNFAETVPGVGQGIPSYVMARQRGGLLYVNIAYSGTYGFHDGYDPFPGVRTISILGGATNGFNSAQSAATMAGLIKTRTSLLRGLDHFVVWMTCTEATIITGDEDTQRLAYNVTLNANNDVDLTKRAEVVYDAASVVTTDDTVDGTHFSTAPQIAKVSSPLVTILQAAIASL